MFCEGKLIQKPQNILKLISKGSKGGNSLTSSSKKC